MSIVHFAWKKLMEIGYSATRRHAKNGYTYLVIIISKRKSYLSLKIWITAVQTVGSYKKERYLGILLNNLSFSINSSIFTSQTMKN